MNAFSWNGQPSSILRDLIVSEMARNSSLKIKPVPILYSIARRRKLIEESYKKSKKKKNIS